jgi:hypothetical protein
MGGLFSLFSLRTSCSALKCSAWKIINLSHLQSKPMPQCPTDPWMPPADPQIHGCPLQIPVPPTDPWMPPADPSPPHRSCPPPPHKSNPPTDPHTHKSKDAPVPPADLWMPLTNPWMPPADPWTPCPQQAALSPLVLKCDSSHFETSQPCCDDPRCTLQTEDLPSHVLVANLSMLGHHATAVTSSSSLWPGSNSGGSSG